MNPRSITTTLMGMGFVVMTLLMGTPSAALAAGTLTVDWPNYSRNLVAGMSYFIKWTPGNAGASVKIELLKAGKRTKWVTTKTANDGEYIWKIPKSVKKNSKYKIKITSTKNPSIYDDSDNTFTIYSSSNWWKESFDQAVNLGIEDDGSGTWGDLKVHGNTPHKRYAVDVVNKKDGHPVRKGKQSVRFQLRVEDCGGADCDSDWGSSRSELMFDLDEAAGDDRWYAWSIYHKNYIFLNGGVSPTHGQFKPSVGTAKDPFSNNGAFYIMVSSFGGMQLQVSEGEGDRPEVWIPASQFSNQWHDILVHAKWSTGVDGLFKVWVDGKQKLVRKGRNIYANRSPKWFRFGIYRPQIYRATNKPIQIVYYDELVRGSSCDDVSQFMTCPGGGSLKVTTPNGKEKWKTKNDGKHAWKVPSTLVNSAAYKVKISSTKNKKLTDSSDKHFTITK